VLLLLIIIIKHTRYQQKHWYLHSAVAQTVVPELAALQEVMHTIQDQLPMTHQQAHPPTT